MILTITLLWFLLMIQTITREMDPAHDSGYHLQRIMPMILAITLLRILPMILTINLQRILPMVLTITLLRIVSMILIITLLRI